MAKGNRPTRLYVTKPFNRDDFSPSLAELVEDRRQPRRTDDTRHFHPEADNRPPLTVSGTRARFGMVPVGVHRKPEIRKTKWRVIRGPGGQPLKSRPRARGTPRAFYASAREVFAFTNPRSVVTCLKRKIRREVLFAFKKQRAGRGRKKHRTWRSNIRC